MNNDVVEFLLQSNAIEGVEDGRALAQAIYAWEVLLTAKEMAPHVIMKTHKILMIHQPLAPYERGYFRTVPVWVGRREAMDASLLKGAIEQWVMNVNDLVKNGQHEDKGFLENMIKEHHVNYEKIHPFVDGNGRTGRMFMNWERLALKLPVLIIHTGEEQQEYYGWFK